MEMEEKKEKKAGVVKSTISTELLLGTETGLSVFGAAAASSVMLQLFFQGYTGF